MSTQRTIWEAFPHTQTTSPPRLRPSWLWGNASWLYQWQASSNWHVGGAAEENSTGQVTRHWPLHSRTKVCHLNLHSRALLLSPWFPLEREWSRPGSFRTKHLGAHPCHLPWSSFSRWNIQGLQFLSCSKNESTSTYHADLTVTSVILCKLNSVQILICNVCMYVCVFIGHFSGTLIFLNGC